MSSKPRRSTVSVVVNDQVETVQHQHLPIIGEREGRRLDTGCAGGGQAEEFVGSQPGVSGAGGFR